MRTTRRALKGIVKPDLRLREFAVFGLFGEYNYTIPFNLNEHVTAIIAPNGTGKTLCLRMIYGLLSQRWSVFFNNSFHSVRFSFTDGSVIIISKYIFKPEKGVQALPPTFVLGLQLPTSEDVITWSPQALENDKSIQVDRYIPYMSRLGDGRWRHDHTAEIYTVSEVIEVFGGSFPDAVRESFYGPRPIELINLISQIDCRLIETQRLLVLNNDPSPYYYGQPVRNNNSLAIARKAEILRETIAKELATYAVLSQNLDRSFPKRVIENPHYLPAEDLKQQLAVLDKRRLELTTAGILDKEGDSTVSLPPTGVDAATARVLNVYAKDSNEKLDSLTSILRKLTLFRTLIDRRFGTKQVNISKTSGFDVSFKGGSVPLDRLSSGEQHQLVLFFELLFEIKQNALILIDEPELSLHIAWQKKFIKDLKKIIEMNKFDVLLATHSPQLVARWTDLVVELGDVEDDADDLTDEEFDS